MVLKIKRITITGLLIGMCLLSSCEELFDELYIVDCDECELTEPITCTLNIKLEDSFSGGNIYNVTIYRGKMEDGIVLYNVATYTSVNYTVGLNSEYTVTASVMIDGKEYIAVDATRPKVDVITDSCDETCYYVRNNTLNLKIKYY